jgi:hypothetical protein
MPRGDRARRICHPHRARSSTRFVEIARRGQSANRAQRASRNSDVTGVTGTSMGFQTGRKSQRPQNAVPPPVAPFGPTEHSSGKRSTQPTAANSARFPKTCSCKWFGAPETRPQPPRRESDTARRGPRNESRATRAARQGPHDKGHSSALLEAQREESARPNDLTQS